MSLSRRTVLSTAAVGLATVAAANAQTPNTPAGTPQPTRPGRGGTDPGPRNVPLELQNPDIYVPPATDHGTVANLKFPFSQSHMRLERGGWTRQVTERELGISKNIAGVDMRLNTGGVRELHWHKAAEWAYMLYGRARITAVD
jgi:oxalate decarboxylase